MKFLVEKERKFSREIMEWADGMSPNGRVVGWEAKVEDSFVFQEFSACFEHLHLLGYMFNDARSDDDVK